MKSTRPLVLLAPLVVTGAAMVLWPADDEAGGQLGEVTRACPPDRVCAISLPEPDLFPKMKRTRDREDEEKVAASFVTRRLRELDQKLGLSAKQWRGAEDLLTRSSERYAQEAANDPRLAPAISRKQAMEGIHALLDPVQQFDYEDYLFDEQVWWRGVVERLERDIEDATDPVGDLSSPTEPAPAARRGGNVLDLLNPPQP